MKLPVEIRDKIFRALLGDQVLHISRFSYTTWHDSLDSKKRNKAWLGYWEHCVCLHPRSEDEDYRRFKHDNREESNETDIGHVDCMGQSDGDLPVTDAHLDLRILRVCRQLYHECSPVVWTTNTFSFDDGVLFSDFMSERSFIHKKLMKRLHLHTNDPPGTSWNAVSTVKLIRSLQGLRELLIRCEYRKYRSFAPLPLWELLDPGMTKLLKLRILPLAKVTVNLDDPHYIFPRIPYWSIQQRREVAHNVERYILDSKGGERVLEKELKGSSAVTA